MIGSLLRWFKAPNPTLRPRHDVTDRLRFGRISWHIILANQLIRVGSLSHSLPVLFKIAGGCFRISEKSTVSPYHQIFNGICLDKSMSLSVMKLCRF